MSLGVEKEIECRDGIHGMLPTELQPEHVRKYRAVYACTPDAPIFHKEGWYYSINAWREQGLPPDLEEGSAAWNDYFSFDPQAHFNVYGLGWTESEMIPAFEEEVVERRDNGTEVIRDRVGRKVLMFHDRRSGFMPEYLDHPVKDMKSWEEEIKWRLDPNSPERKAVMRDEKSWYETRRDPNTPDQRKVRTEVRMAEAVEKARQGYFMVQRLVGGYMYLRSLIGPEDLFYMFVDDPELIHSCMEQWFELSDAVTAEHQKQVSFDEVFFGEDICYKSGSLISPAMMEEFFMPYYKKLVENMRARQLDQKRHLFMQLDTDGKSMPVIDIYAKYVGMDVMSPFEVASGCDVVEVGKQYPDLIMHHGIDKRILAKSKEAIDAELERIIPAMKSRGGYFPACDHGVPAEVSLENYLHYRKRMVELGG